MEVINKQSKVSRADATSDIDIINQYTLKQLSPDEVFCFSVVLCDNDIDRSFDRFADGALDQLAKLFVGKTGIMDHERRAENQIARLYKCAVQKTEKQTQTGRQLRQLVGSAYMLRNETNQPFIDAINAGIMREVSVGCAIGKSSCSICGTSFSFDLMDFVSKCENGHVQGKKYDSELCVRELSQPVDAYEFSFVAVPAQRGAGVTKAFLNDDLILKISATQLSPEEIGNIMRICRGKLQSEEEKAYRAKIIAENNKILGKEISK